MCFSTTLLPHTHDEKVKARYVCSYHSTHLCALTRTSSIMYISRNYLYVHVFMNENKSNRWVISDQVVPMHYIYYNSRGDGIKDKVEVISQYVYLGGKRLGRVA